MKRFLHRAELHEVLAIELLGQVDREAAAITALQLRPIREAECSLKEVRDIEEDGRTDVIVFRREERRGVQVIRVLEFDGFIGLRLTRITREIEDVALGGIEPDDRLHLSR